MQGSIPGPVPAGLTVIETMRAEADGEIRMWPLHLARLTKGCAAVGFPLDEDAVTAAFYQINSDAVSGSGPMRVRLTVDAFGMIDLTRDPLPENPAFWRVSVSDVRLQSDDPWLMVKTSHRPVYNAARAAMPAGYDEVILLNEQGAVCEGTITNLFLRRDGLLLTPPLRCGLLPGVLRESLLARGDSVEADLYPADLTEGELFCGNALRGLIPAQLQRPED